VILNTDSSQEFPKTTQPRLETRANPVGGNVGSAPVTRTPDASTFWFVRTWSNLLSPRSDKRKSKCSFNAGLTTHMSEWSLILLRNHPPLNQRVPGSSSGAPTIQILPNRVFSRQVQIGRLCRDFRYRFLVPFGLCGSLLSLATIWRLCLRIQKFRSWRTRLRARSTGARPQSRVLPFVDQAHCYASLGMSAAISISC
jgi:hypothetical protein